MSNSSINVNMNENVEQIQMLSSKDLDMIVQKVGQFVVKSLEPAFTHLNNRIDLIHNEIRELKNSNTINSSNNSNRNRRNKKKIITVEQKSQIKDDVVDAIDTILAEKKVSFEATPMSEGAKKTKADLTSEVIKKLPNLASMADITRAVVDDQVFFFFSFITLILIYFFYTYIYFSTCHDVKD